MNKILGTLILLFCLNSCRCELQKCGTIVKIVNNYKNGKVLVRYANGEYKEVSKRRPNNSLIGSEYCECVEYKFLL